MKTEWLRNLLGLQELMPIKETCQLCGTVIITGHLKKVRRRAPWGEILESWEGHDHEMTIPNPCPNSPDGKHAITGL